MRKTYMTGTALIAGLGARYATIMVDDGGRAVCQTLNGTRLDPWSCEWTTLRRSRGAARRRIEQDHRYSPDGPRMFGSDLNAYAFSERDRMDFPTFAHTLYLANSETWKRWDGTVETVEDRASDLWLALSQPDWETTLSGLDVEDSTVDALLD